MTSLFTNTPSSTSITTKEASDISGYSSDYLARLAREGKVRGTQVGRSWVIDRASLESFIDEQKVRKAERADELAREREREYRQAQQPLAKTSRVVGNAVEQIVRPVRVVRGTPFTRTPLFASAVALSVVVLCAFVSTSQTMRATLAALENEVVAVASTLATSVAPQAPAFRATEKVDTEVVAAIQPPTASELSAYITHATSELDNPYAQMRSSTAHKELLALGEERVENLAHIVSSPRAALTALTYAYRAVGHDLFALGSMGGDAYASFVTDTGTGALARAALARDAIKRAPDVSEYVLASYENSIYAWVESSPKIADRIVADTIALGGVLGGAAAYAPTGIARGSDAAAVAWVQGSHTLMDSVIESEVAVGEQVAAVGEQVVVAVGEQSGSVLAALGSLGGSYVPEIPTAVVPTEIVQAPAQIESSIATTLLGVAGNVAVILEGTPEQAEEARTRLTASIVSSVPVSWQRPVARFFSESARLAHALIEGGIRGVAQLFPSANIFTPQLAVIPLTDGEAIGIASSVTDAFGTVVPRAGGSGTTNVVGDVINNYFPQAIISGPSNDAILALVRPFVQRSIDAIVDDIGGGGGGDSVDLTNVAITGGTATLTSLTSVTGTIEDLSVTTADIDELTAATTSLGTTTVAGDLTVSGTITGGSLSVSSLSSGGAVIAPYFTATSTSATSTFPNLEATNAQLTRLTATNATTTTLYSTFSRMVEGVADTFTATLASITNLTATNATSSNATSTNLYTSNLVGVDARFTNATSTNLYATLGSFATASSSILTATNATLASSTLTRVLIGDSTTTNATTTTFYTSLARILEGVVDNLTATIANITNLTATNATSTNATSTNLYTSNLVGVDARFTNATSTNLFATNLTATGATTTALSTTNLGVGGSYFTSLLGTGLVNTGGVLSVSTSSLDFDTTYFKQGGNAYGTPAIFGTTDAQGLSFTTNNSTRLTLTAAGLFGVGTTTPSYGFSVATTSYFADNTIIGSDATDTVTVNGRVTSNIIPLTNNAYDLGSATNFWRRAYVDELVVTNLSAGSSSVSGTISDTFIINSNNLTADTEDASLIFHRGTQSPNAAITWDATDDVFDFNYGIVAPAATITAATTTNFFTSSLGVGSSYFTSLLGTGLINSSGVLTVSTSTISGSGSLFNADLLDGLDSTYLLANAFASSSANFWLTTKSTNNLAEGTNLYYTDARVNSYIAASSTIPKTYTTNSFSASQSFTGGLTTNAFTLGSDAALTSMLGNGLTNVGGVLTVATSSLSSGFFLQNGNTFGTTATLGTNDNNALVFETNNTEALRINTAGQLVSNIGSSASTPSFTWTGDLTTGIFHPASNQIGFSTGGIQRAVIDGNGYLGVGTSSPFTRLSVEGNAYINGSLTASTLVASGLSSGRVPFITSGGQLTDASSLTYDGTALTAPRFAASSATATSTFAGGVTVSGTLRAQGFVNEASLGSDRIDIGVQNGTPRMVWENAGHNIWQMDNDLGNFRFFVAPNVFSQYIMTAGAARVDYYNSGVVTTSLNANGASYFNGGSIGIGTTSPTSLLHLSGSAAYLTLDSTSAANSLLIFSQNATSKAFAGLVNGTNGLVTGSSVGDFAIRTQGANTLFTNNSGSSIQAILTSSGNLGIGTTSPYAKLSVVGQTVSEYFTATSTTATSTFPNLLATNLRLSGRLYDSNNSAGTNGMILQTTGSTATWVATSSLGLASAADAFIQNGNTFGTTATLGTNDNNALVFETNNTEALRINTAGQLVSNIGSSASTPSFTWTGDLTTGIFHPASNQIGFSTGGIQRAVIDGNGYLGVGTSSPVSLLSVDGQLTLGSTATSSASNLGSLVWNGTSFYGKLGTATSTVSTGWFNLAQDNTIDVFLIAGQSNADGRGVAAQSPNPIAGTAYQYKNGTLSAANDPVGSSDTTGSAWPAFAVTYYNATGRKVLFVPQGKSGAAMAAAAHVNPANNWDTTGDHFDDAVAEVSAAMSAARAAGFTPVFKGVLWAQGETDAIAITNGTITSSDYESAFVNMIARFRTEYGASMPFFIFQTGTDFVNGDLSGFAAVRAVQESVAALDRHARIVFANAIDYPSRGLMKDQYHYNQEGLNEMGRIAAANIASGQALAFFQRQATTTQNIYFTKGNLGIGTTSPSALLTVWGSSTGTNALANFVNSASSTVLRIQENGRIGIGTTSPNALLHLSGSSAFLNIDSTSTSNSLLIFSQNSTFKAFVGVANSTNGIIPGSIAGDLALRTEGKNLLFSNDSGASMQAIFTSTGRLGIGTTSPGSTLSVSGDGYFTGSVTTGSLTTTGQFIGKGSDTVSTPSFTWGGDLTTGFWHPTTNTVALSTGGIERLRVNSSGYVGIGTSTPNRPLTVDGDSISAVVAVNSNSGSAGSLVQFTYGGASQGYIGYVSSGAGGIGVLNSSGTGAGNFLVTNAGNVGIGTTSPSQKLHVYGDQNSTLNSLIENPNSGSGAYAQVRIQTASANNALLVGIAGTGVAGTGLFGGNRAYIGSEPSALGTDFYAASGNLRWFTGGSERMQITSGGNVGIGTTSPSALLTVWGSSTGTNALANFVNSASSTVLRIQENGRIGVGTTTPWGQLSASSTSAVPALAIQQNSTGPAAVLLGGNIGIGTTTPGVALSIAGTEAATLLQLYGSGNGRINVSSRTIQRFGSTSSNNPRSFFGDNAIIAGFDGLVFNQNDSGTMAAQGAGIMSPAIRTLGFYTSDGKTVNTERARINSNGQFGVGTTTLWGQLSASSTSAFPTLAIQQNSTGPAAVFLGGSVGIGTTNPVNQFVVGGSQSGNAGLEVSPGSGIVIQSYNRNAGAYASLRFDATTVGFRTKDPSGSLAKISQVNATTLNGAAVGLEIDYNTSITNASQNFTGLSIATAAVTAANTNTLRGITVNPGAITNSAGATTYRGINIQMPAITQSAGSLTSTGLYIAGGTVTSGTSYGLIVDSTAGNVGIGTTTPSQKLEINGNLAFTSAPFSIKYGNDQNFIFVPDQSQFNKSFFIGTGNLGGSALSHSSGSEGYYNIGIGGEALLNVSTGIYNTAIGFAASRGNTSGISNMAIGLNALYYNQTGSNNVAIGVDSAFTAGDASSVTSTNQSIFIGGQSAPAANSQTNQIVIGYAAVGNGSNSATIGNDSITKTVLKGSVGIGTADPAKTLTVDNSSAPQIGLYTSGTERVVMSADTSSNFTINTAGATRVTLSNAGALRLHAYGTGTLSTDANGNVTASSDERLKDISGAFARGLADLENLNPITYFWSRSSGFDQENEYAGFSAQNVQSAIPEAVGVDQRGFLTLSDRPILAATVNAIKELAGRTESLSFATTSLSTRLSTIEAQQAAVAVALPQELVATVVTADSLLIAEGISAGSLTTQSATIDGTVSAARYVVPATAQVFTLGSTTVSVNLPDEVLTQGSADLYKVATYALASVTALSDRTDLLATRIDGIEERLAQLEAQTAATSSLSQTTQGVIGLTLSAIQEALSSIGIVIEEGLARLNTLVLRELVFSEDENGTSSAGSQTIAAGDTEVEVANAFVLPSSKIFITFTTSLEGSWYVEDKENGSFTVRLAQPQSDEVSFDYFLVQTQGQIAGAAGAQPPAIPQTPVPPPVVSQHGGPTVSLNGSAAVQVPQGGAWTDPGATARAQDGTDLTSSIAVSGGVDTQTPGLYTLTYRATDLEGRFAEASRVVSVLAPTMEGEEVPQVASGGGEPAPAPEPTPEPSPAPAPEPEPAPEPPPAPTESASAGGDAPV